MTLLVCVPGRADLVGTDVTGSGSEFFTSYIEDTITANFTGNQLTLQDWVINPDLGAFGWTQMFTDAAFARSTVSLVSEDYTGGGVFFSQSGDTLTFTWAGIGWLAQDPIYTATYNITPAASSVPEPSGIAVVAAGFALAGLIAYRKRCAAA